MALGAIGSTARSGAVPLSCAARAASDSRSSSRNVVTATSSSANALPLLAAPQPDHRELGAHAGELGHRAEFLRELGGAFERGDRALLVAEEVLGDAEVAGGQRRGAADQHAAERFDLLEEVVRGAEVAGRAFSLRELDREHRPRVGADHRVHRQPGERLRRAR